jgi:multidrug transporter EmrE-like cation transporter
LSRLASQYALLLVNALSLLAAQLLLKQGMTQAGVVSITNFRQVVSLIGLTLTTPKLLAGICLSAVSTLLWLITLSRLDLSYAVPALSGIYYIMILLASTFFLGEHVTLQRWAGAVLIIVALALISDFR